MPRRESFSWRRPGGSDDAVVSSFDPTSLQGAYYVVTGIWPIVHLPSFMYLTGPKHDTWLVKTFGAVVVAIGFALLPRERSATRRWLSIGSALALSTAEVVFVARRQIHPIYLADATLETWFALANLGRPASLAGSRGFHASSV
jgi:hypothetical protein